MTALPIHPSVIDVNRTSTGHGDEERTNKGGGIVKDGCMVTQSGFHWGGVGLLVRTLGDKRLMIAALPACLTAIGFCIHYAGMSPRQETSHSTPLKWSHDGTTHRAISNQRQQDVNRTRQWRENKYGGGHAPAFSCQVTLLTWAVIEK